MVNYSGYSLLHQSFESICDWLKCLSLISCLTTCGNQTCVSASDSTTYFLSFFGGNSLSMSTLIELTRRYNPVHVRIPGSLTFAAAYGLIASTTSDDTFAKVAKSNT